MSGLIVTSAPHHVPLSGMTDFLHQRFAEKFSFINFDFPFGKDVEGIVFVNNVREYWTPTMLLSVFYVVAIFAGIKYMKNREPFVLNGLLAYWNLFLAVFSLWGSLNVLPFMFHSIFTVDETALLCSPGSVIFGKGQVSLAVACFVYSKIFELFDTVLLVLRKKPVNFLHWFHHFTVLAYTWDAYSNDQGSGMLFIGMNYTVHAVMYFYYYLAAIGKRPKWDKFVTTIQITQMIFGTYWTIRIFFLRRAYGTMTTIPANLTAESFNSAFIEKYGCQVAEYSAYCGVAMYTAYLLLFVQFFVKRYVFGSSKKTVKSE
eukprot:GDKK01068614.1.p1 GENE.GDKK01068614.1~~GDKK01068614.1.p1  ORF type:complete len:316 (-),score=71.31 GDKK01068614.1:618-1565(-)